MPQDLRAVIKTMFDACGTITEALRTELVTVAENQVSLARLHIPVLMLSDVQPHHAQCC